MLWPCFILCASVPSRTSDTGARICVEGGVGGIVAVVVEWLGSCWVRAWFSCSYSLCTSCLSHRREWVPWLGAPVAPRLAKGLHVSLGRGRGTLRGSGALMTSWGSDEAEIIAQGAYLAQDLSARLEQDGGWLSALSNWHAVNAFSGSVLPGPLRWGFSKRAGCGISPSIGTLVF
jgi:hypothetical protein